MNSARRPSAPSPFSVGLGRDNAGWRPQGSSDLNVPTRADSGLDCAHGGERTRSRPGRRRAAPFDGSLQRLAEILGALHYLRGICGANEGLKWRVEMQSIIDAEAPSGDRRARIIANFNRGYRGFQQTYRTCTPAADLVIRRYLEEGSKIAREMTARYAN